jgi:multidrug efflux system outer membrane protein
LKNHQSAFRDVADALAARQWLTRQLAIAETAVQVQTERARLSTLRYDNGAAPFLDVLDAQRDLLGAPAAGADPACAAVLVGGAVCRAGWRQQCAHGLPLSSGPRP